MKLHVTEAAPGELTTKLPAVVRGLLLEDGAGAERAEALAKAVQAALRGGCACGGAQCSGEADPLHKARDPWPYPVLDELHRAANAVGLRRRDRLRRRLTTELDNLLAPPAGTVAKAERALTPDERARLASLVAEEHAALAVELFGADSVPVSTVQALLAAGVLTQAQVEQAGLGGLVFGGYALGAALGHNRKLATAGLTLAALGLLAAAFASRRRVGAPAGEPGREDATTGEGTPAPEPAPAPTPAPPGESPTAPSEATAEPEPAPLPAPEPKPEPAPEPEPQAGADAKPPAGGGSGGGGSGGGGRPPPGGDPPEGVPPGGGEPPDGDPPREPSDWERESAKAVQDRGASMIVGLGNTVAADMTTATVSSTNELALERRRKIAEALAEGLAGGESPSKLRQRVADVLNEDYARDLDRIIATELANALNEGLRAALIERFGEDAEVVVQPSPSACRQCLRAYLDEHGEPRRFPVLGLPPNTINFRRRQVEWVAAMPPLHPWCMCTLLYAPPQESP